MAILGAFVHLNIQFQTAKCNDNDIELFGLDGHCIGRNLIWLDKDELGEDSNLLVWRAVFSLRPDIFVDVWTSSPLMRFKTSLIL